MPQFFNDDQLDQLLFVAQAAAIEAGRKIQQMRDTANVREKKTRDLVTDADIQAQQLIARRLLGLFPDFGWIGEEDGRHATPDPLQPTWLVDPIDGTANYAHRLPGYGVSIALVLGGKTQVAVVHDPVSQETFSAMQGFPAMKNGVAISVSGCQRMGEALIASSFPPGVDRDSADVQQFLEVLSVSQSVRRLGSAALNLCHVACGRLDAYWTASVQSWDIAAGALICQQAGAIVTSASGGSFSVWDADLAVAASPQLHLELLACLSRSPRSSGPGQTRT
jgi:myo-inositol-1(or 4)-monophosphatase